MLRFANLILANAEDSSVAPLPVRAMISDEPGFFIAPSIVETLRLNAIVAPRQVTEYGMTSVELVSGLGPVRVCAGEHQITAIADEGINGVIIGSDITSKLRMEVRPAATDKNGDPSHILIRHNAVSADICRKFCEHTRTHELTPIGEKYRTTLISPIKPIEQWVNEIICELVTKHIEPFYNLEMETWELPQLLVYKEGGIYKPHADGAKWVKDGEGKGDGHWERFLDRDISLLLYLNDEFTGGHLHFPAQEIEIKPEPGLLVAFPSSAAYRHGAEQTQSGYRVVLVSWMSAFGTPRLHNLPVPHAKKAAYLKPGA